MKKIAMIGVALCATLSFLLAQTPKKPAGSQSSVTRGKKVYEQYCLTCHQVDGSGVPHLNPPLIKTSFVLGDKGKLIQVILKGMQASEPIDDEYYSNNMPPHNFLKDQEIADVLTYVRRNFGNKASAVTTADVKTARAKN
ncbi:mono/diheme cytochrome c family protein [Chitinophaga polysaccharea]|uniref:Mono/diheme cytochrome c family protein n=1 Tax=Chitinophaga polysaccharea TaxID=1293035 RepID=A0A561Q5Q1_9BACT|nr:c-type cytochrome [Chitinophaga polysaccharea]TWF45686.1 mono/diheme cytochrome c family protein [Chitinophaga polysaccharea]